MAESPVIVDRNFAGELSHELTDYPGGLIFPLDKPYRWTSADAVRKVKFWLQRHFHDRKIKVGHAGTLDPLATGLLIICVGRATKLVDTLQSHTKEYVAEIEFGATTPCYDLEKEIDQLYPFEHITQNILEEALEGFIGPQKQVPPVFSAKLIGGTRAYEYARAGEAVEMKSSLITIESLHLDSFGPGPLGRPRAVVTIRCSKGTYIRSFARDLGLAVGSGAHLTALRRTLNGDFEINNAIDLDFLVSSNNFVGSLPQ